MLCVSLVSVEAGYVATPIAMVQAAITILNEPGSLPKKWVHPASLTDIGTISLYIISLYVVVGWLLVVSLRHPCVECSSHFAPECSIHISLGVETDGLCQNGNLARTPGKPPLLFAMGFSVTLVRSGPWFKVSPYSFYSSAPWTTLSSELGLAPCLPTNITSNNAWSPMRSPIQHWPKTTPA